MATARNCTRTGCTRHAVATLTYAYAELTAVVGPLAGFAEPHSYDLCAEHARTLTVPRGWEVVRHDDSVAGGFPAASGAGLGLGPDDGALPWSAPVLHEGAGEDDLAALVDLLNEPAAALAPAVNGHGPAVAAAAPPVASVVAPALAPGPAPASVTALPAPVTALTPATAPAAAGRHRATEPGPRRSHLRVVPDAR